MGVILDVKEVKPLPDGVFAVSVEEGESMTTHTVTVSEVYLQELGWETDDVESLLVKSFKFMLKRESKESILREFDLSVISRYFPEYEERISKT